MRWFPLPLSVAADVRVATLSPAARCAWLAMRMAHAGYGFGGVVPTQHASPIALPLVAPAVVAGVDVAAALEELRQRGLIVAVVDGVRLEDWDAEAEQALCATCKCRNPDPRHRVCPRCRDRKRADRGQSAGGADKSGSAGDALRLASDGSRAEAYGGQTAGQTEGESDPPDWTHPTGPTTTHTTEAAGGGGPAAQTAEPESGQAAAPQLDARAALASLRDEARRRALLADAEPQPVKVRELLAAVGFGVERPDRQLAAAQAIAERRGDDAVRWLLDVLHDIAADPTCDVPAVLAHRIKNGALEATEQSTTTMPRPTGRPPRPADHDAGAADRARNEERRRREHAADPDGRLCEIVAARVLGDRADPRLVADELGVPVERVAELLATEQRRRAKATA